MFDRFEKINLVADKNRPYQHYQVVKDVVLLFLAIALDCKCSKSTDHMLSTTVMYLNFKKNTG